MKTLRAMALFVAGIAALGVSAYSASWLFLARSRGLMDISRQTVRNFALDRTRTERRVLLDQTDTRFDVRDWLLLRQQLTANGFQVDAISSAVDDAEDDSAVSELLRGSVQGNRAILLSVRLLRMTPWNTVLQVRWTDGCAGETRRSRWIWAGWEWRRVLSGDERLLKVCFHGQAI